MKFTNQNSFTKLLILSSALVFILTACGPTVKVSTDYDRAANFSNYKTFAMYTLGDKLDAVSSLNSSRIISAIKASMISKGFTEDATNPSLLVNTVAILKNRQSVTANTNVYGYGGGYRPYGYWGGGGMGMATANTTYDVQNYKDGSLIIDIVDASTKKLVWQGTGNAEIDGPIKDPDTFIPASVTKIMASFPPGAAK